jgi:hypothetical protein
MVDLDHAGVPLKKALEPRRQRNTEAAGNHDR